MAESEESNLPSLQGKPLFRFAVIADTHLGPQDGVSPSPWKSNALANARARAAVRQLNGLKPAFVVHLGDMIHPVPAQPEYTDAAKRFHEIFSELEAPLHFVAGNHDMGDKPTEWVPAKIVNDTFITLYEKHFGAARYSFDFQDVHFVVLNSQVMNSGLDAEQAQWDWLEADLEKNKGKRLFVFGHYPLYLASADEDEHYDNVAEPARAHVLNLLREYKADAFFSAHVHNFFYNRDGATTQYVLPSATALRLDYAELFSVAPEEEHEFGRNDWPKLGFFMVEVFADGHVAHYVRTGGKTEDTDAGDVAGPPALPLFHTKHVPDAPVGIELRHAWADTVTIPYSGVVDAFSRKPVRNDYMLAAIWEMGMSGLRVPLEDVVSPTGRERMADLVKAGNHFSIFVYGIPEGSSREILLTHRELFRHVEIILPSARIANSLADLKEFRDALSQPVFLSRLRSSSDHEEEVSGRFAHSIDHGFHPDDEAFISGLNLAGKGIDGLVFQTRPNERVSAIAPKIIELAAGLKMSARINVRMAGENAAQHHGTAANTAALVCDALMVAYAEQERIDIVFDTLIDVDRGYFPRNGFIDRRMNPTDISRSFSALHAELASRNLTSGELEIREENDVRSVEMRAGQKKLTLLTPMESGKLISYELSRFEAADSIRAIKLATGEQLNMQDLASGCALPVLVISD